MMAICAWVQSLISSLPAPVEKRSQDELPSGFLPYDQFEREFSLGKISTEKIHEQTKALSQTLQSNVAQGLNMLLTADQEVWAGLKQFIPTIAKLSVEIRERIEAGGRIFLVGSGSSGRVAVDLAAKCGERFPGKVRGIIAGGDGAMIRAKEGFEDSEKDGEKCLQSFDLKPKDTVFLISASGSAPFNVGCGHFAANRGAKAFYFYNSKEIPERTKGLFQRSNNPVVPLELDIGPQAIAGSTRLQGASIAELGLGALLGSALFNDPAYPNELLHKMNEANELIAKKLGRIAEFVKEEADVFRSPNANFRRLRDETFAGYATYLGDRNTLREILIDATETSPTFSTNPIRREQETKQKRAEFRAYLVGEDENRKAWSALLGREVEEAADADQFLLAAHANGNHSFENRPTGSGNFVLGVAKVKHPNNIPEQIADPIEKALKAGGKGGMIVLSREAGSISPKREKWTLLFDQIPFDRLGLVETVMLKQVLNLISNGSMVLMNKVHGNRMIDVRTSNRKLIDRTGRLIQEIWKDSGCPFVLSGRELYHWIAYVSAFKNQYADLGVYTPSVVKIILALLHLNKTPSENEVQEALSFLRAREERLDFLAEENYTLCIDGGGSKTLLQVLDSRGQAATLYKQGSAANEIMAKASNINVVKKEGVKAAFSDLFTDVSVGPKRVPLSEILPKARVIAGLAGVSIPENIETVTSLFADFGIDKRQLLLMTDAELALRLLKGNGIVLISGTGSICFMEKEGARQRVGGLGRILGDEGSGYQIGLSAIRAALAEEFGYGPPTRLTPVLRAFYQVAEMKSLFPKINSLDMSAADIAAAASFVFEEAEKNDAVASEIVSQAANDLRQLVTTALKISHLKNCEMHLWGGVFKGRHADRLIKRLREATDPNGIRIVNQSSKNAAVVFARNFPMN